MKTLATAALAASALLAGCAGYENTTRDAAVGAGLGAAAGAVIGNNVGAGDATTGALVGAAVGGAAGAARGCQQDNHDLTALNEIDPVSGPVIDPQLRDTLANGLVIPGVPE